MLRTEWSLGGSFWYYPVVARASRWERGVMLATLAIAMMCAAPLPTERDDATVRRYAFTARVKPNGGVTPFAEGSILKGTFAYDLHGVEDRSISKGKYGYYGSPRNAIAVEFGALRFV